MATDPRQLRFWRYGLALWLAVDTLFMAIMTAHEGGIYTSWLDAPGTLGGLATNPWLIGLLAIAALGGAADFARRPYGLAGGIVYLVAMAILDRAFGAAHGTFGLRFYYSALLLLGWLLGRLLSRAVGLDPRSSPAAHLETERSAALAALALFSTAYLNACISKLTAPGLSWVDPDHLRLVILSRMAIDGSLAHAAQSFLVDHPAAVRALNVFTLVVEGGAPLLLIGPRVRAVWGTLLIGFHLGVYLTLGLFWGSAIYFLALTSYPWHRLPFLSVRLGPAAPPFTAAPAATAPRTLAVLTPLALALAALWLLPIPRLPDPVDSTRGNPHALAFDLGARTPSLGPLREGADLSPGWRLDGIYVGRDTVHAELRAAPDKHAIISMGPRAAALGGYFREAGDLVLWYQPTPTSAEEFAVAADALAARLRSLAPPGQSVVAALSAAVTAAGLEVAFPETPP
jgi:hypothetical protein